MYTFLFILQVLIFLKYILDIQRKYIRREMFAKNYVVSVYLMNSSIDILFKK